MWVFNLHLTNECRLTRDTLVKKLLKNKIETRDSFVPINKQKTILKNLSLLKKKIALMQTIL